VWNYFCLNSQVVSGKGLGGSNAQIVIVIPIIVGAALMALATARQAAAEPIIITVRRSSPSALLQALQGGRSRDAYYSKP